MTTRVSISLVEEGKQAQKLGCEEGDCIVEICGDRGVFTIDGLKAFAIRERRSEFEILFYSRTRDALYNTKLALGSAGLQFKGSSIPDIIESRIQKRIFELDNLVVEHHESSSKQMSDVDVLTDSIQEVDGTSQKSTSIQEGAVEAGMSLAEDGTDDVVDPHAPTAIDHGDQETPEDVCFVDESDDSVKELMPAMSVKIAGEVKSDEHRLTSVHDADVQRSDQGTVQLDVDASASGLSKESGSEELVGLVENEVSNNVDTQSDVVGTSQDESVQIDETEEWPDVGDSEALLQGIEGIDDVSANSGTNSDSEEQIQANGLTTDVEIEVDDSTDTPSFENSTGHLASHGIGSVMNTQVEASLIDPPSPTEEVISVDSTDKNQSWPGQSVNENSLQADFSSVIEFSDDDSTSVTTDSDVLVKQSVEVNLGSTELDNQVSQKSTSDEPLLIDENDDPGVVREVKEFLEKTSYEGQVKHFSEQSSLTKSGEKSEVDESDENDAMLDFEYAQKLGLNEETMASLRQAQFIGSVPNVLPDEKRVGRPDQKEQVAPIESDVQVGHSYELISQLIYQPQIPIVFGSTFDGVGYAKMKYLSIVQVTLRGKSTQSLLVHAMQHFEKAALEAGASAVIDVCQQVTPIPFEHGKDTEQSEILVSMCGTAVLCS